MSDEQRTWGRRGFGDDTMRNQRRQSTLRRFWLKRGETRRVVFLESDPFNLYEHSAIEINDDRNNYFTCPIANGLPGYATCPFCARKDRPPYVGYLTIGDLTEYTGQRGTTRFIKKAMALKKKSWEVLSRVAEKRKGLLGCVVEVYRTMELQAPNSGSSFDFEEKVDVVTTFGTDTYLGYLKTLDKPISAAEFLKPYDWAKVLEPLPAEELERLAAMATHIGTGDRGPTGDRGAPPAAQNGSSQRNAPSVDEVPIPNDDDIPF